MEKNSGVVELAKQLEEVWKENDRLRASIRSLIVENADYKEEVARLESLIKKNQESVSKIKRKKNPRAIKPNDFYWANSDMVKKLMSDHNMTQYDLGDAIGCKQPSISAWIQRKTRITMMNAKKIAELFEVDISTIIDKGDRGEKTSKKAR